MRVLGLRFELTALAELFPEPRDGREQHSRVRVLRVGDDLVGRPDLDDPAQVHDREDVTDVPHRREIVGDEDHRDPEFALQLAHEVENRALDRDVAGGRDLVGD